MYSVLCLTLTLSSAVLSRPFSRRKWNVCLHLLPWRKQAYHCSFSMLGDVWIEAYSTVDLQCKSPLDKSVAKRLKCENVNVGCKSTCQMLSKQQPAGWTRASTGPLAVWAGRDNRPYCLTRCVCVSHCQVHGHSTTLLWCHSWDWKFNPNILPHKSEIWLFFF